MGGKKAIVNGKMLSLTPAMCKRQKKYRTMERRKKVRAYLQQVLRYGISNTVAKMHVVTYYSIFSHVYSSAALWKKSNNKKKQLYSIQCNIGKLHVMDSS